MTRHISCGGQRAWGGGGGGTLEMDGIMGQEKERERKNHQFLKRRARKTRLICPGDGSFYKVILSVCAIRVLHLLL